MISLDTYRPDHPEIEDDFTINQNYERYTTAMHRAWRTLFKRQLALMPGRACEQYIEGIHALRLEEHRVPKFTELSEVLFERTGWRVVPVPGLLPDEPFFDHLARRSFPAAYFIRSPDKLDYIEEPDIFHDVFGHVPLLANHAFANFMEAYGKLGQHAMRTYGPDAQKMVARLYWYTAEFGLITTQNGLRIYGSGIVSSKGETIYSLQSASPDRIGFDVERIMSTDYCISDFQETYFVISSFDELFKAVTADFTAFFERAESLRVNPPGVVLKSDAVFNRGTHSYRRGTHAAA